jgi:hypothetical protein
MAITGKLTALKVAQAKRPGLYGDGGGLYLQVTKHGRRLHGGSAHRQRAMIYVHVMRHFNQLSVRGDCSIRIMTRYGIVAMPVVPLSATARALALRIAGTRSGKQARLLAKEVE